MSGACQNKINPRRVQREGSDQKERISKALMPDYAPVDARTEAHDLVFARDLARSVIYYAHNNLKSGHWQGFFDADLSVLFASVSLSEPATLKDKLFISLNQLKDDDVSDGEKKKQFTNIFRLLFSLAGGLDDLYRRVPNSHPAFVFLQNLTDKLLPFYQKLVAYYEGAELRGLIDESGSIPMKIFGEGVPASKVILIGKVWVSPLKTVIYNPANADESIFGLAALPVSRQLFLGSSHNFFTDLIHRFLQAYGKVIYEFGLQLVQSMKKPDHQPHMALFLAYTKMMMYSRDHLNTFTGQHLDLYYRDILRLREKIPQASQAHLLVEAAKHVESHWLKKGSLLKAGKNAEGGEVFFATDEDLVVNHASISSLKSVYRGQEADDTDKESTLTLPLKHRLFMQDELPLKSGSSGPFVAKSYNYGKLAAMEMTPAVIGFAVASHYLWLNEGVRTITLTLDVSGLGNLPAEAKAHFTARITTEKEWTTLNIVSVTHSASQLILNFAMTEKDPPSTPWNEKVHGGQYQASQPLIEISLKHLDTEDYILKELYKAEIQKVQLKVGAVNVRNLVLQNDIGGLDSSKPFMPFGANPKLSGGFMTGNSEIFQKKSNLKFNWPFTGIVNPLTYKILRKGSWENISAVGGIFTLTGDDLSAVNYEGNEPLSVLKTEGYLKAIYNDDYQATYATYLVNLAAAIRDKSAAPALPPVPALDTMSIDYDATTEVQLDLSSTYLASDLHFYHKHPFGAAKQHVYLSQKSISLLPAMRHENFQDDFFVLKNKETGVIQAGEIAGLQADDDFSGEAEHEAEFYFGVQGLKVPGFLSVLFQVEDGTANPMISKPEHHVHWSYLSERDWVSFKKGEVFDKTMQLLQSGIIGFSLGEQASQTNNMMPLGHYWIRASVTRGSEAVSKLVKVAANAVSATLLDPVQNESVLQTPLAAGTISKLLEPAAEIKTITQPFDAFGGRPKEKARQYYTRVSERLRHKDRAVAAWDYEKMVLEQFPALYKAKCLNHTLFDVNAAQQVVYNEMSPGHVTVILVPDLHQRNLVNPLRPFVSVEMIENVSVYLAGKTSAFVALHVRNPIIEEVRMSFQVRIFPQYDESFYQEELKREITRYLSPWAFDAANELVFGGQIEKSAVINFIEERSYVDFITEVKLYHLFEDEDGNPQEIEVETAKARKGASILVSVPAAGHLVDPININTEETATHSCGC